MVALVLLALSLVLRWPGLLASSIAVLGAQYAVSLIVERGSVDPGALLTAGGLILVAELSYWSLEVSVAPIDRSLPARRLVALGGMALGAVSLATLVLIGSELGVGGGLVLEAVGVAAAVVALALVARLARPVAPPA